MIYDKQKRLLFNKGKKYLYNDNKNMYDHLLNRNNHEENNHTHYTAKDHLINN